MNIIVNAFEELKNNISKCNNCGLCETRNNIVFGEGNIYSPLVIIGEAPGEEEDLTGRPFVGKAGELLTNILKAAGFNREEIYITNVVKCRPPENRDPDQSEQFACRDYLESQLLLIRPKIIITMGNVATKSILSTTKGITSIRGQLFDWRGIKLFPMFHPSFLLRNESRAKGSPKDLTWQDIKYIKKLYDEVKNIKNDD